MKLDQPIGNALFAPLLVRVGLGSYFVLAGLYKLQQHATFIKSVQRFGILPEQFALIYAITLPYVEVGVGVALVVGLWMTLASALSSGLILSFIIAVGTYPNTDHLFNKDIILLGASLSLLYSGSGAYSVDRFRKSS